MVLDIVSLQTVAAVTFFTGTRKYPKIIDVLSTLQRAYRDLQYTKREDKTRVKVFVITIISTLLFKNIFSKIRKMKSLMNTYWMLCNAVYQANDFYCDQLMAVTFSLFVHVTIKSYFSFLNVRAVEVFASTRETVWVLPRNCYVLLLFNSSTEVTNSLEGFLLQLPHQNARFSARGFLQIHKKALTSMAGAVTTYLVILIQFQAQPPQPPSKQD
ncbi:putative gustatory receptor 28b [Homalodisca vitripennis]|uniref:putative gustatory receptor 28b n=1 Tax=Homalodisca vitripennis TaxID=197043 RepID=UPI001EEC2F8C|nr:putative gustatory receptor 28b [Homalodisca vitripennis]